MTVATQLEILDLRHFSARQLRPLLEAEARIWEKQLRWNYQGSTELLLQYLDSRILPGYVALDRGRVCGFTFCVYEGHKAVVGDAFALSDDPAQALLIAQTLLHQILQLLQHSPDIQRVESQLLLYNSGSIDDVFLTAGFSLYPRLFMERNLLHPPDTPPSRPTGGPTEGVHASRSDLPTSSGPVRQDKALTSNGPVRQDAALTSTGSVPQNMDHINLTGWHADHYQAAAELIHESYIGHIDARINDQYCSLHGSLRFLHNIVRFPGCGVFDATASWVLYDRHNGALVGMVLCSRVAEDVAHITQLCIAPRYRGHGFGRRLLDHCIAHLTRSGFAAITLTVTEANHQAVELYKQTGFFIRHRFDAMVLDKS
jgi:ribosomal protein S18 acetylase RimI-like enzyme